MSSGVAIVVFYGLLAAAVFLLRGDLTTWPRSMDRLAAFAVCLGAVVFLLRSWKPSQPLAWPAEDGSSKPRPPWLWWAGIVGLAAFVFLAALPPLSEVLARPLAVERTMDGRDAPGRAPPPPSDDGSVPNPDGTEQGQAAQPRPGGGGANPGEAGEGGTQDASTMLSDPHSGSGEVDEGVAEAEENGAPSGVAHRVEAWIKAMLTHLQTRPPWFIALLVGLSLLAAGLLWWWLARHWRGHGRPEDGDGPRPPWHDDPAAPAYVHEFRRLCEHLGHPPRPGDTWRDLLVRLVSVSGAATPVTGRPAECAVPADSPLESLEPVAVYHYRVRYEGATADHSAERGFVRLIRAVRKAAISAPATGKATAASAER